MIKSAATVALVPQIKVGPWIYWKKLEPAMSHAAELGFDGIELFTPSPDSMELEYLKKLLDKYSLELAAVGTGAGKVLHGLTLTDPDPSIRKKAISFIKGMIAFGGAFGAPAIIGSMQGNALPGENRERSIAWLRDSLDELGEYAADKGSFLLYEPLNRYETNLINTLDNASELLGKLKSSNVKILADLFHMNIEEENLASSLDRNMGNVGHIHLADSNRRPMGLGHTEMGPISVSIKSSGYKGFISAEAFPYPDPESAAQQTINSFKEFFS